MSNPKMLVLGRPPKLPPTMFDPGEFSLSLHGCIALMTTSGDRDWKRVLSDAIAAHLKGECQCGAENHRQEIHSTIENKKDVLTFHMIDSDEEFSPENVIAISTCECRNHTEIFWGSELLDV